MGNRPVLTYYNEPQINSHSETPPKLEKRTDLDLHHTERTVHFTSANCAEQAAFDSVTRAVLGSATVAHPLGGRQPEPGSETTREVQR